MEHHHTIEAKVQLSKAALIRLIGSDKLIFAVVPCYFVREANQVAQGERRRISQTDPHFWPAEHCRL